MSKKKKNVLYEHTAFEVFVLGFSNSKEIWSIAFIKSFSNRNGNNS